MKSGVAVARLHCPHILHARPAVSPVSPSAHQPHLSSFHFFACTATPTKADFRPRYQTSHKLTQTSAPCWGPIARPAPARYSDAHSLTSLVPQIESPRPASTSHLAACSPALALALSEVPLRVPQPRTVGFVHRPAFAAAVTSMLPGGG
jgi:hypothetical protein